MKTVAVSNFKGGVGKTTVAFNLACELSRRGKRVLLVDMDPQGTLSYWLRDPEGIPVKELAKRDRRSIANVLIPREVGFVGESSGLADVSYATKWEGVDVAPAYLALQKAKDAVLNNPFALRTALDELGAGEGEPYDLAIIDTRPDLDNKTTNAYAAAEWIVLPCRADGAMQEGLIESLQAIAEASADLRLGERRTKVLRSMVKERTNRDEGGKALLEAAFEPGAMFSTCIHDTVKLGEATGRGLAISELDERNRAAQDFSALAEELLGWIGE